MGVLSMGKKPVEVFVKNKHGGVSRAGKIAPGSTATVGDDGRLEQHITRSQQPGKVKRSTLGAGLSGRHFNGR